MGKTPGIRPFESAYKTTQNPVPRTSGVCRVCCIAFVAIGSLVIALKVAGVHPLGCACIGAAALILYLYFHSGPASIGRTDPIKEAPSFGKEMYHPEPCFPEVLIHQVEMKLSDFSPYALQEAQNQVDEEQDLLTLEEDVAIASWIEKAKNIESKSDSLRICLAFLYHKLGEMEKAQGQLIHMKEHIVGTTPLELSVIEGLIEKNSLDKAVALFPRVKCYNQVQKQLHARLSGQLIEALLKNNKVADALFFHLNTASLNDWWSGEARVCALFRIAHAYADQENPQLAVTVLLKEQFESCNEERRQEALFYLAKKLATLSNSDSRTFVLVVLDKIKGHEEEKAWLRSTYFDA